MPDQALLDDLRLAHVLADQADAITMARFKASDLRVDSKPDLTPVTDADTAVEDAIRNMLSRTRPRDAVHGEERADSGWGPRRWVIDPIDGTANFVRGVPVWGTLIGLMVGDEVVAGVVSAPALSRRWWAAKGGLAPCDDQGPFNQGRCLREGGQNRQVRRICAKAQCDKFRILGARKHLGWLGKQSQNILQFRQTWRILQIKPDFGTDPMGLQQRKRFTRFAASRIVPDGDFHSHSSRPVPMAWATLSKPSRINSTSRPCAMSFASDSPR